MLRSVAINTPHPEYSQVAFYHGMHNISQLLKIFKFGNGCKLIDKEACPRKCTCFKFNISTLRKNKNILLKV